MDRRKDIAILLSEIDSLTPGGFAIGLHIMFRGPTFLFQTFPQSWLELYIDEGLQMKDPAVAWSLANTGHIFWKDLAEDDPANVMGRAAKHGMPYGATLSILQDGSRSVLGCARTDRDYLEAEIDDISALFHRLHSLTFGRTNLPNNTVESLRKMSIRLSHG